MTPTADDDWTEAVAEVAAFVAAVKLVESAGWKITRPTALRHSTASSYQRGYEQAREDAAKWFDAQPEISHVQPARFVADGGIGWTEPERRTRTMFSPKRAADAIRALPIPEAAKESGQ